MDKLEKHLIADTKGKADEAQIIAGDGFRITVITERLIRVETSLCGGFADLASQAVFFRNTGFSDFTTTEYDNTLIIRTSKAVFCFNKRRKKLTSVYIDGECKKFFWRGNLRGTARTLDMTFGWRPLSAGVVSKRGVAVLDDGRALLLSEEGTLKAREQDTTDLYYFAHGKDYRGALADFYLLSGKPPLLPRYAFGNWWSRFHAYTQDEFLALMHSFKADGMPFTVATLDMDWHWTYLNERFGTDYPVRPLSRGMTGWTGYSFNTDLFPNYKQMLAQLKDMGYQITLNLHPKGGVRWFEDMYRNMAEEVDVYADSQKDIPFEISSPKFANAYFKVLHRPYEADGVDFWWIDWQQGTKSEMVGLDPLWALNHYHYLDSARDEKRGLVLSRYAGAGSHRYPVGFSGDTVMCWHSLKFQPYFTSTAANIGFTYWSHDIGGHYFGKRDDELYLRWLQFGVFSPINRLHAGRGELMGKDPRQYRKDIEIFARGLLSLRQRLIPYIYSASVDTNLSARPLCEPMYYNHPEAKGAYRAKGQYYFGSELIVAPVTKKVGRRSTFAKTKIWLPKGRYTDIFTGEIINSNNNFHAIYSGLDRVPVFAKEGAVIPLASGWGNDCSPPDYLDIWVYRGNSAYKFYEDDGITKASASSMTEFIVTEADGKVGLTIKPAVGGFVKAERGFSVFFNDIEAGKVTAEVNGKAVDAEIFQGNVTVKGLRLAPEDEARITVEDCVFTQNPPKLQQATERLARRQGSNLLKQLWFDKVLKKKYE
jgi:alpha-glucosidase (family GH31 glycosyl hydrolase)